MKLKRLTEIMGINTVRVYAHWSVLVIGTLILLSAIEWPVETIAAWSAYFGVILIHECGHMIAAQRKRCEVRSARLVTAGHHLLIKSSHNSTLRITERP